MYAAAGNPRRTQSSGKKAIYGWTLDKDELFKLIKKAVREVVRKEMGRVWLEGLATVTDEEQEDINRRHGKPDRPRKTESRETVAL